MSSMSPRIHPNLKLFLKAFFLIAVVAVAYPLFRRPSVELTIPLNQVAEIKGVTSKEVLKLVSESKARLVLLNMWASWCEPCRDEFPDLVRIFREFKQKGVDLIFVSNDFESDKAEVQRFLAEQGVEFPTYIKTEKDDSFINAFDERWTGALPATFFYKDGKLVDLIAEWATYEEFKTKVETHLK